MDISSKKRLIKYVLMVAVIIIGFATGFIIKKLIIGA